jgi:plastocyanin
MQKLPAALLTAAALTLGLAACGGSSSSSSAASSSAAASAPSSTSSAAAATTPSSSAGSAGAAGGRLSLAADPSGQLKFTQTSLSAKAGKVSIKFTNKAPEAHNLTIQRGTNGPTVAATPTFKGGTQTVSVKLAPGTYTFYCSIPGHRMGGMQGTLTVS